MKYPIVSIIMSIVLMACDTSKKVEDEASVSEVVAEEVLLVPDNGLRVVTSNYYHTVLQQKKLRPKNFLIRRDTVTATGKEDSYRYVVKEILIDTPQEFKAKLSGGHVELDQIPKEFELSVHAGVIKTTKLENGAFWYEVTQEMVPEFESELDKQGFIFHR